MVVVKQDLSEQNPDAVREVHRLLLEAAKHSKSSFPEHNICRSLTMVTDYAVQQGLIPRAFTVDELFDDVTRPLLERMPQR
jgi:4,5-dihydroxyphthalate decarboxylase